MSIQRTAIFYIILILGEFSNVTFQGEVMAPPALNNSIPSPNESELSSVNSDSSNKIPRSYWNPYTIAGMVSGAVIPIIYVLWRPPVSLKKEYASVENLAGNMIGVSRLGIAVTTYLNLLSHFIEDRSFYALLPLTLLAGAGAAVGFGFGLCSMKLVDLFKVNTDHKSIVITNVKNHYVTNNFIILPKIDRRELYDPTVDVLNSENNVTGSKEQLSQVILQINGSVKKPCVSTTDNENCDNSSMVFASAITDVKNCTESMNNSNWEKFKLIWNKFTLWGAVAGAVVFTPLILIIPQCLGFAASGILPMSCAARMMSSSAIASGGGVVVGSLVAILQSIGALGVCSLGFIPIGIIISIGAAFGFGIGYVVKMTHDWLNPDQINGLNDTASFDHNCKTIAQTNSGNSNLITNFTFDSEINITPTSNELLATNLSSTHDEAIDSENGRKKLDNRDRSSTKLANPQTVTDKVLNGITTLPPNEILTTSEKTQTLLKEINSETEVPINNQSQKIVHHIDLLNNSYIKPKFNNESVWPTPISNHSSLSVNFTTSFGAEIENGTFRHDNGLPAGDGSNTWDLIKTWSVNTWSDVRNGTENAWSSIVAWTKGDSVGSNACLSSSQPSVLLLSLVIYLLMTGSR